MQELNQTLANIAVTGLFQGQTHEAASIVNYLELESVDQESLACLRGLTLFSEGKFDEAISSIREWTQNQAPGFSQSLLALFCWKNGQATQAESYCLQVLEHSNEASAAQLARDLLQQMRNQSTWNQ